MVGKRVRELRIKRGLSQQDLGLAIGVTKVSVCGYENGTRIPNLEKLIKLAEVLETTTDYLLGRKFRYGTMQTDLMLDQSPTTMLVLLQNLDIILDFIIRL